MWIPTPTIMLESHSIPHLNLKASILIKILPTHTNASPQTTSRNTLAQLTSPSPHSSPKFIATTLLQSRFSSTPKRCSHFPNRVLLKVVSFLIPKPLLAIGTHFIPSYQMLLRFTPHTFLEKVPLQFFNLIGHTSWNGKK